VIDVTYSSQKTPQNLVQITIDIVSDVVCPWCIIGYKELQRAVDMVADRAVISVRWHPFELAPATPPGGQSIADYGRERYGATPEQSAANRVRITERGAQLGIDFRYGPQSRIYNTRRAHQLLAWAGEHGGQTALKMALFNAYFTDQSAIDDPDVLLSAVEMAGLDRNAAQQVLDSDGYRDAVTAEISYWQDQNITGVPAFIINGKYMIPGAQDGETFAQIIDRVIAKEALNAHQ
jgi:predicted DsbA family dithiol-disulfide isomerase